MQVLLTTDSASGRDVVGECLRALGHDPVEPQAFGAGALLATTDVAVDLLVVVLLASRSPRDRLASIAVEAGVAIGRGMPLMLVARPGVAVPFLTGVPRIDYAGDPDLLQAQLDLVLHAVRTHAPRESATSSNRGIKTRSTSQLPGGQIANHFERAVAETLMTAGAEILGEAVDGGRRNDFALVFPGESTALGLVLVEVKTIARNSDPTVRRSALKDAARALSLRAISAGAGLGVLIYDGPEVRVPTTPLTISMAYERLVADLKTGNLAQILWRARNEAIHAL